MRIRGAVSTVTIYGVMCFVLNHFLNWEASFNIDFLEGVYSRDKLVEIINMAGFSIGIGSGRTSGYGRYHISNISIYE